MHIFQYSDIWEEKLMEKAGSSVNSQTQLAEFMKEVRESFLSAGKAKEGWLRRLLKNLFN